MYLYFFQLANATAAPSTPSQEAPIEESETNSLLTEPIWWREDNFDKTNLILIGFSKGCVVLNQV